MARTSNFSKVFSAELEGIRAKLVTVETDLRVGLHAFNIVGLADKALSEAKERVSAAIKNTGIKPPNKENRKIVVNLAPADLKKNGSQYDLAIAVGYLLATKQIKEFETKDKMFVGELALDGALRPVSGILNIAEFCKKRGLKYLILPQENAAEAALVDGIDIIPVSDLNEIINYLEERKIIEPYSSAAKTASVDDLEYVVDLVDIKGQENAKRALIIAAAGGHNLLMVGAPGGGKTMLAQALLSLLSPLSQEELIEVTQIYSVANLLEGRPFINNRPFRSPHHNASVPAVVGGGTVPKPGEISLAHRGVLFLDEFPEFRRDILEALRQPLENGKVSISRSKSNLVFPARFMLVAAMNPCPCGYYNDDLKNCKCGAHEVNRYQKKISGPLMDRIDLQINVPRVELEELRGDSNGKNFLTSVQAREQINRVREIQAKRLAGTKIITNSEMNSKQCESLIKLSASADQFLQQAFNNAMLSARGYYRILKVARTIADLDNDSQTVEEKHLAEAFSYRLRQD